MDNFLQHPVLGRLELVVNPRARRFVFRPADDGLKVTVPRRYSEKELLKCIDELLPKLQQMTERKKAKQAQHFIGPDFRIETDDFRMTLAEGDVRRPLARLSSGILQVTYPKGQDFQNEAFQQWLVTVVESCLRHLAKQFLPARLEAFARQWGFHYNEVKIHKSHGRWGSCNTRGNINLSLYLMLLPHRLQDYVMLHELCHTLEMNHSARFWAQLDRVTNNQAVALRNEMKHYDTSVFYRR